VRKQLGLTFLGETRSDAFITGDIRLKSPSLDRDVYAFAFIVDRSALLIQY